MKIERIKIEDYFVKDFEAKFGKKDKTICVLENEYGSFLKTIKNLFLIDNAELPIGQKFDFECDIYRLNKKFTVQCKGENNIEESENGQKGIFSNIKRGCICDEKIYSKNKLRLKCFEEFFYPYNLKWLANFDEKWIDDLDTILGLCLDDEFFVIEKLDNDKRKLMTEIAENYLKEISPIILGDGRQLYFEYDPNDLFTEWEVKIFDGAGEEIDYYKEREKDITIRLIEYIIANNVVLKWCNLFFEDLNFPLFISDVFGDIKLKNIKSIMDLIKKMDRQVFIILREPNELVSSYADKTIEYYFNPDNKIEEELPF